MNRLFIFAAISNLFIGCGTDKTTKKPNLSETELLQVQVDRIESQMLMCDGGFAFPRNNNLDGRVNCDVGDSMLFTGILLSTKPWSGFDAMKGAIEGSIAPSGQPYRAPSYMQGNYKGDAFSRDQFIGFMHYLVTTKDTRSAAAVITYLKSHENDLCPDASDSRCSMTLGMKALADDVYKYIGIGHQYNVSRDLDDNTMVIESNHADKGYPMHLVSQKIFLRVRMDMLNTMQALAAQNLRIREPNNLWFQYLDNLTHKDDSGKYNQIKNTLTTCMQSWQKPGNTWTYQSGNNVTCEPDSVGSDMVWLGKLLLER